MHGSRHNSRATTLPKSGLGRFPSGCKILCVKRCSFLYQATGTLVNIVCGVSSVLFTQTWEISKQIMSESVWIFWYHSWTVDYLFGSPCRSCACARSSKWRSNGRRPCDSIQFKPTLWEHHRWPVLSNNEMPSCPLRGTSPCEYFLCVYCILYTVYKKNWPNGEVWFICSDLLTLVKIQQPSLHEIILWRVKWRSNICRIQDLPTW